MVVWKWLVIELVMLFALVGCQANPEVDTAVYRTTLNDLSAEVTATTLPLAQLMAQGQAPSMELVTQLIERLTVAQEELDALGVPPAELAPAHQHLTVAIVQFLQAYAHLAHNLENGESMPFDQEFLTLAAHGGEAIHQTAAALGSEQETK